MLDQQDIKQIGQIVEEKIDQRVGAIVEEKVNEMGKGLEQRLGVVVEEKVNEMGKGLEQRLGKMIEETIHKELGAVLEDNILPQFEAVNTRLDKVEGRLEKVEGRLGSVENNMVTKWYLDDKLGDLKGDIIILGRKQDKKVNFMIESLDVNSILPEPDIKLLRQMEVFPSATKLSA